MYVQVSRPAEIRFGHPFGKLAEAIDIFEFDNHSDETMLGYARRLVKEAEDVFVYLEVSNGEEKLGVVRGFVSGMAGRLSTTVIMSGVHPMLDRMAPALGIEKVDGAEAAVVRLSGWLEAYKESEKGSASR